MTIVKISNVSNFQRQELFPVVYMVFSFLYAVKEILTIK